jgi:hypothetical protein
VPRFAFRRLRPVTAAALIGLSAAGSVSASAVSAKPVPGIDPQFIYRQLAFMATHFQRRESGYLSNAAGHGGFAAYWTSEMLKLLGPFGASARRFPFKIPGWLGRPATARAFNVEVTVPGVTNPAKVVVIGCHYDGEAISTQSANDDASGCAIELGVAEAMARFWHSHGLYPARTLRFVIFDAEEQGLLGSFDYLNHEANATVPGIVAMFNEEQNGIGYPLRFLGSLARPLMPTYIYLSPPGPNNLYRHLVRPPAEAAANRAFASTMTRAVAGAFAEFRRLGYQALTYHGSGGKQGWKPIFTKGQVRHVRIASDTLGSSDQIPFTLAGIPDAMFIGNWTYYDSSAPAGSYPFDRPQDTIGLMNTFADGGAGQSQALTMALALPGMLTTWMLSQPGVLGQARPDGRPVAAIGSIGRVMPRRRVTFTATAFLPGNRAAKLRYSWHFGDGTAATGRTVGHAYASAGTHTLRLTVSAPGHGARTVSQVISAGQAASYANPYVGSPRGLPRAVLEGRPPANPEVTLPVARPGLRDKVGRAAATRTHPPTASSSTGWVVAAVVVVVLASGIALVVRRRMRVQAAGRGRSAR